MGFRLAFERRRQARPSGDNQRFLNDIILHGLGTGFAHGGICMKAMTSEIDLRLGSGVSLNKICGNALLQILTEWIWIGSMIGRLCWIGVEF